MNFFDKITGRFPLQEEIKQLKRQLKINLTENTSLLQDRNRYQNEVDILQEQNSHLGYSNQDLLRQLNDLKYKLDQAQQRIENYDEQLTLLGAYKESYGEIKIEDTKSDNGLISDLDEDNSFFEFLLPKNDHNPFNADQINAIRYNMNKHLRIIAGAGSGKTQTICAKATYLTMMENVPEDKIAMITFTKKAATEMEKRIKMFSDKENCKIKIGTFHNVFKRIFEELKSKYSYIANLGINGADPFEGGKDYNKQLNYLIKEYNLKKLDEYGEKSLSERISYWTSMGYTPSDMVNFINKHFSDLVSKDEEPLSERFKNMLLKFYDLRKKNNILTFDDYFINLLNALEKDESAREYAQNRFDYIFIDEFQDTNPLQMKIINLLCPPKSSSTKLIIVGDDDQSIYSFRGANPSYIKEFDKIYDTYTTTLMTNYRSTSKIVQAGNRIIAVNKGDRIEKTMNPFHKATGDCYAKALSDTTQEAEWIIEKAREIGHKCKPFKDMINIPNFKESVILYRSVGQLKSLLFCLDKQQIPYVIEGNEDILGIFNINQFKWNFRIWKRFMESNTKSVKIQMWNNLIEQTGYLFFKNKSQMSQFINESNGFITPKNAAEFICSQSKDKSYVQNVEAFFYLFIKIRNGAAYSLDELAKLYLSFPLIKENLTTEESSWIQNEFQHFQSWSDLINRYESLKKTKEEMKKQLNEYHAGNLNALYLMTIHKSKGLSIPNVFIIGLHNEGLPIKQVNLDNYSLQDQIEKAEPPTTIEEERRLMYVAVTRPQHNLYVTFPKTINNKPCKRSIFLKELKIPIK
ncbi:ATP-dependent helicase [Bacillus velezensis]|uniref:ATP-dependent helicase n=1 Tax=Bacillus velezensis TaxID=492670 RepID=UPI001623936E|nr:ATP-dependent helicase [Bacillus velezensis]MBC2596646.1 UvrD-helicase domain-containing protein [Bacillus velezensis]